MIDIPSPFTPQLNSDYPFTDRHTQELIQNSETARIMMNESGNNPMNTIITTTQEQLPVMSGGKKKQYIRMKSDGTTRQVRYDGKKKYVIYKHKKFYLSKENKGKYTYV